MPQIVPPWLPIALAELGEKEVPGSGNNPRIVDYHQATSLKATTDITPWCASFVNWCLWQSGVKGTNSAAARSFLDWGRKLGKPQLGAIAVFKRGSNPAQGHVGFALDVRNGYVYLLGGNQSDLVCISLYAESQLLDYRWPTSVG